MLWNVPITIATKGNPEAAKFVLDKPCDTITVEDVGPDDYILVSLQTAHSPGGYPFTIIEERNGPWGGAPFDLDL